ncbi:MAG: hypothetical protein CMK36_01300 [Porticoccaceae bacterium]|nr:hypothetical protein [Porticoccaceae bacterium]
MINNIWKTEIIEINGVLRGPPKRPRQMLAEQEYDGHLSIHDNQQAQNLGFLGAPIEGPTHFSQFDPILHSIWGDRWFEVGCISAHFKNVVIEGESVIAFVQRPTKQDKITRVWALKDSGEFVLEGTASLGPTHPATELEKLLNSRPTAKKLVILENVKIGDRSSQYDRVKMGFRSHLGKNYPFTLAQKLKNITELCDWYCETISVKTPWGAPIIPFEMVNPLVRYTPDGLPSAKGPSIGLFADLEVKMINGPLLVNQEYLLDREVVGLGESKRTESMWIKTHIRSIKTEEVIATTLLNTATLKDSYELYKSEAKRLEKC